MEYNVLSHYELEIYNSKNENNNYLVVCHGFGDKKILYGEYKDLFDVLINDYSIVTFTFSKCDNHIDEVDSVLDWVEDLNNIIHWIKEQKKDANIMLLGISLGAWIATLYCATNHDIKKNICIGPVFTLHMGMKSGGIALLYSTDSYYTELSGIKVNNKFLKSLIENQPINLILNAKYYTETIMLVGTDDNIYRQADIVIIESLLRERGVSCDAIRIDGGKHFINNEGAIQVLTNCIIEKLNIKR